MHSKPEYHTNPNNAGHSRSSIRGDQPKDPLGYSGAREEWHLGGDAAFVQDPEGGNKDQVIEHGSYKLTVLPSPTLVSK